MLSDWFEWDDEKAALNIEKHGVSFEEARTAFDDPLAITQPDFTHSEKEDRFLLLGRSERRFLLLVCHTHRSGRVRIISARDALLSEEKRYEQRHSNPRKTR